MSITFNSPVLKQVRHKKRGTSYMVLAQEAHVQWSGYGDSEPKIESVPMTIYTDGEGGWYCRPTFQFNDGRFTDL